MTEVLRAIALALCVCVALGAGLSLLIALLPAAERWLRQQDLWVLPATALALIGVYVLRARRR